MRTPYILPQMLQYAPLGVDWDSVGPVGGDALSNFAALLDVCQVATGKADAACALPIRATTEMEQLTGPGSRYLNSGSSGGGVAHALMKHWPIIAVLGAQYAARSTFPRQWTFLPANQMDISDQSSQILGGSSLGVSGGDGDNGIDIYPGIINWWGGRGGWVIQIAYTNGFPHCGILPSQTLVGNILGNDNQISGLVSTSGLALGASAYHPLFPSGTVITEILDSANIIVSNEATGTLSSASIQFGYGAGVTTLNVDDTTGFAGTNPSIYDGAAYEVTTVTAATATNPVPVIPNVTADAGPGTVTLAQPTQFPHTGTNPPTSLLTTMPDAVRLACYYYAAAEAMTRGATAITAQSFPGSTTQVGGTQYAPRALDSVGDDMLRNFKRVV